jgi:hypothetical protein
MTFLFGECYSKNVRFLSVEECTHVHTEVNFPEGNRIHMVRTVFLKKKKNRLNFHLLLQEQRSSSKFQITKMVDDRLNRYLLIKLTVYFVIVPARKVRFCRIC